ncbi:hypothetical protein K402DRAFT_88106 [Aulographum hederae CBS 113979]|uniref:Uncharacterized protein n=1 Tax=Aulographum hederae CBS 113979 TaxID=1176131 RepID=A0A6G1H049_9PEZI|nr:hypothetical protein K402DRAFT_88106 [Aulographum hederae CBS 113979]
MWELPPPPQVKSDLVGRTTPFASGIDYKVSTPVRVLQTLFELQIDPSYVLHLTIAVFVIGMVVTATISRTGYSGLSRISGSIVAVKSTRRKQGALHETTAKDANTVTEAVSSAKNNDDQDDLYHGGQHSRPNIPAERPNYAGYERPPYPSYDAGRRPRESILPSYAKSRFIPESGIDRVVITADIQRYLGPDASVQPGKHGGIHGYWITAVSRLTPAMIQDLQADSVRWKAERHQHYQELHSLTAPQIGNLAPLWQRSAYIEPPTTSQASLGSWEELRFKHTLPEDNLPWRGSTREPTTLDQTSGYPAIHESRQLHQPSTAGGYGYPMFSAPSKGERTIVHYSDPAYHTDHGNSTFSSRVPWRFEGNYYT